jgi:flagellar biosynthesis chaperone FliJ
MRTVEFRRRAFHAQQRASTMRNEEAKAELSHIANEWLALAEQLEWLEGRYRELAATSTSTAQDSGVVQKQQQRQPGKSE